MSKLQEAKAALLKDGTLFHFLSVSQRKTLEIAMRGEEGAYFVDLILAQKKIVDEMPKTYETDGQGTSAKVWLHYFRGGIDAWVSEKDKGDGTDDLRQLQAFGAVNLGCGAELGYVGIQELIENNVEMDLHWDTSKTLKDVMK